MSRLRSIESLGNGVQGVDVTRKRHEMTNCAVPPIDGRAAQEALPRCLNGRKTRITVCDNNATTAGINRLVDGQNAKDTAKK